MNANESKRASDGSGRRERLRETSTTGKEKGPSELKTWFLPVTSCRDCEVRNAQMAAVKLNEVVWGLWDPLVSLRFVVAFDRGRLCMGWAAASENGRRAKRLLVDIRSASMALTPWVGFADLTLRRPWRLQRPPATTFSVRESQAGLMTRESLAARVAASTSETWQLVVELVAPPQRAAATSSGHFEVTPLLADPVESEQVDAGLGTVTLHATAATGLTVGLIEADGTSSHQLVADPQLNPLPRAIPDVLLAHLLMAPARSGELLPKQPEIPAAALLDQVDAAATPHSLWLGASGQGKTTAVAAMGARGLANGRTVIAVDVHDGDLLHRLRGEAQRLGRPFLFIDLSGSGDGPTPALPLAEPPPGVSTEQHVDDVLAILQHDVWAKMPADYFGPVGLSVSRTSTSLAANDPDRRFGYSQLRRLLDPSEREFRSALLRRIDNQDLERAVVREILPMVTSKDADNAAVWMASKFDPFTVEAVRNVVESYEHRIPVEEAVARGWSLFLHAPSSFLGDQGARLIVALFLHRVWGAVRRSTSPPPVMWLLDEWQKYASSLITYLLAESRKFGSRVILANQNLAQLDQPLRESVLSNTGAVGCFRLGPADAAVVDELFPTILKFQMQTLAPHRVALTTFNADLVAQGPAPLPPPSQPALPWGEALMNFWGGPEPALPIRASQMPRGQAPRPDSPGRRGPDGTAGPAPRSQSVADLVELIQTAMDRHP